jgi:DNA mismatch repair protein MSH5
MENIGVNSDGEEGTQFLVALCSTNRELGISCYDELTNTLYSDCISISADNLGDTLNNIKTAFNPTIFLVHPRMISNKSLMDSLLVGQDGTPDFYRFKVLKSSSWNEKSTLQLIFKQLVVKEDISGGRQVPSNNYQRLASKIDLDNELVRQSLGALLSFMQSTIFHLDEGRVIVSSIKPFPMESYMRIDQTSLKALQIFSEEVHPNVIKGQGRSKEGFSLFGLFDRTHSVPGRQKLREWMSKPYFDKQRILDRQLGAMVVYLSFNCTAHHFLL